MSDDISITSREELEAWLKDKPDEWVRVIALRAALRVFPLVFKVLRVSDNDATREKKAALILQSWRIMLIASVARPEGTWDMRSAILSAYKSAHRSCARNEAYDTEALPHFDAIVAFASADAIAARSGYALATSVCAKRSAGWNAVKADCLLLQREKPPKEAVSRLRKTALWIHELFDIDAQLAAFPHWIIVGPLALITAWYQQLVPVSHNRQPRNIFDNARGRKLALQPNEFWTVSDDRSPDQIMQEVAQILAWEAFEGRAESTRPTISDAILRFLRSQNGIVSSGEIVAAVADAGLRVKDKSVWDSLSRLAAARRIERVGRALYRSVDGPDKTAEFPEAVRTVPSPFEVAWTPDYTITIGEDAWSRLFVPPNRSESDAIDRLSAARQLAEDLENDLSERRIQAPHSYQKSIARFRDRLPYDPDSSVYLADCEIRSLRDDVLEDVKHGLDRRFATRVKRLIEAHYGLRPYFPDLLNFYDDVKQGGLADVPPFETFERLRGVIEEHTPDVFEPVVGDALDNIKNTGDLEPEKLDGPKASEDRSADFELPPDPIKDVDPERAKQHAQAGLLNRIWATLGTAEKGAQVIERIEKARKSYGKLIEPLMDFLTGSGS